MTAYDPKPKLEIAESDHKVTRKRTPSRASKESSCARNAFRPNHLASRVRRVNVGHETSTVLVDFVAQLNLQVHPDHGPMLNVLVDSQQTQFSSLARPRVFWHCASNALRNPMDSATSPSPEPSADPRVDTILNIVARETKIDRDRLQLPSRTDDLGIGSLDLTLVVFEIESHFGIELPLAPEPPSDASMTVGMLVDQVVQVLDQQENKTVGG